MPELPEIVAHAERLHARYAGSELVSFEPLSFTALKTVEPPERVIGEVLQAVGHRGKHLLLRFAEGTFVVHLMQGGRLEPDDGPARRPRGGLARWTFGDPQPPLLLREAGTEHRAGVWLVAGDPEPQPPLADLGPDADALGDEDLARLLGQHPMRLHSFLRDQRIMAGIGRRLANEICHRAGLSPFQPTRSLVDDAERLGEAVRVCINESLTEERQRDRMVRSRERRSAVHGRTGEPCPVCADTVREVAYRDYTIHYCPQCQTAGRLLADNTTSKFLK